LRNKIKRPIYTRWWFITIIAVVILSFFVPRTEDEVTSESSHIEPEQQEIISGNIVDFGLNSEEIAQQLYNALASSLWDEDTISIIYDNTSDIRSIILNIQLSVPTESIRYQVYQSEGMTIFAEQVASTITDAILNLEHLDEYWDRIVLEFVDIGQAIRTHDDTIIEDITGIGTIQHFGSFFNEFN